MKRNAQLGSKGKGHYEMLPVSRRPPPRRAHVLKECLRRERGARPRFEWMAASLFFITAPATFELVRVQSSSATILRTDLKPVATSSPFSPKDFTYDTASCYTDRTEQ